MNPNVAVKVFLFNEFMGDFVDDYGWVEISRIRPDCFISRIFHEGNVHKMNYPVNYTDGLARGFPLFATFRGRNVAYGCWFYRLTGSGVFVNVGRTLKMKKRGELNRFLNLNCTEPFSSKLNDTGCNDYYWCTEALSKGYDSIQLSHWREIIICNNKCSTEPVSTTCPPIELRGGLNATKSCYCNNDYTFINCNNTHILPKEGNECSLKPYIYPQSSYRRKTCYAKKSNIDIYKVFNLSIIFTSNIYDNYNISNKYNFHKIHNIYNSLRLNQPNQLIIDIGGDISETIFSNDNTQSNIQNIF